MASRKRTGARRCGHRVVFARMWIGDGWMMLLGDNPKADARRCTDCGAWLSLGPARDDGEHAERIAVEVRAEELAAESGQSLAVCSDFGPDDVEQCELCGWDDHELGLPAPDGMAAAGWLYRHIATHTEES